MTAASLYDLVGQNLMLESQTAALRHKNTDLVYVQYVDGLPSFTSSPVGQVVPEKKLYKLTEDECIEMETHDAAYVARFQYQGQYSADDIVEAAFNGVVEKWLG
jgi:hypothetical protein